jgi:UDP-N-acetylmuramate--alanine ligase
LNINWTNQNQTIHFIGIGGISMSALAEILLKRGFHVTGSDRSESGLTDHLKNLGATIHIGHKPEWVHGADRIVYTSAIHEDNPERMEARNLGIPQHKRAALLGALMEDHRVAVAISGTHGKTTTTGILAAILLKAQSKSTILLGGNADVMGGNLSITGDEVFVTEACEYKENFLNLLPTHTAILNIEADHLDYYRDLDHIKEAFLRFANLLPKTGTLVTQAYLKESFQDIQGKILTFSLDASGDYHPADKTQTPDGWSFQLMKNNRDMGQIILPLPGNHNIENALAAMAIADDMGIDFSDIQSALAEFTGVHRRMEKKGEKKGVVVYDEYAHHPSEIRAALSAIRPRVKGRLFCVFQSHTFTRTHKLFDDFSTCFTDASLVLMDDIYPAREIDTGLVHAKDLAQAIRDNQTDCRYLGSRAAILDFLKSEAKDGDWIVTVGAGDVNKVGEAFLAE